jgi:hypothetical protein
MDVLLGSRESEDYKKSLEYTKAYLSLSTEKIIRQPGQKTFLPAFLRRRISPSVNIKSEGMCKGNDPAEEIISWQRVGLSASKPSVP